MAKRQPDPFLNPKTRTCARKQPYESERRAQSVADKTRALGAPVLYPYRCTVCKHWHLSKIPPEVARAQQAHKERS